MLKTCKNKYMYKQCVKWTMVTYRVKIEGHQAQISKCGRTLEL